MALGVIIFAAGQGTRMKSSLPKVLHPIAHYPMIAYVCDAASHFHPEKMVLVTSPDLQKALESHKNIKNLLPQSLTLATQFPALGTGHATQVSLEHLGSITDEVLILCGDVPFIAKETLTHLMDTQSDCCSLGMGAEPGHAYGRMETQGENLLKITENKDAFGSVRDINYVWTGVLKAKVSFLKKMLPQLTPTASTGEYHLTQLAALSHDTPYHVAHLPAPHAEEFEGVNDKAALSIMEARMQQRLRQAFLEKGVSMQAPETVFFAYDTQIEEDVTLSPFITFGPGVSIKKGAQILSHCHIEDSIIDEEAVIGPFAHLRGGNIIGKKAAVGNFCEVKKSTLGQKTKAKHHAYLGDAILEENVNIGAGVITCNYDGQKKHTTTIQKGSFVGANATLIAPVLIEENAYVGAGSVITETVPQNTLALGRSRQILKERK